MPKEAFETFQIGAISIEAMKRAVTRNQREEKPNFRSILLNSDVFPSTKKKTGPKEWTGKLGKLCTSPDDGEDCAIGQEKKRPVGYKGIQEWPSNSRLVIS